MPSTSRATSSGTATGTRCRRRDPDFDPVYTGKAMAAARRLDGTTLFLQTDGPR